MKDTVKCAGILVVGLLVAGIIYPCLHELGHALAAVSVGATVTEVAVFPVPYVVCEVSGLSKTALTLTGLAGIFLPAMLSAVIRPRSFWLWYACFVMRGVCLLSFAISFGVVVLHLFGISIPNEDIGQILRLWGGGYVTFAVILLLSVILMIRSLLKQKPMDRIVQYFEMR